MQRWEEQIRRLGIGLNIHDSHLCNLRFADDILLLATNRDDAVYMLEILILELKEIGLILNPSKTQFLTTELHDFDHIILHDGSRIGVINDHKCYKWLGKSICFTKRSLRCHAVSSRIAAAMRRFHVKKKTYFILQSMYQLALVCNISLLQSLKLLVSLGNSQFFHAMIVTMLMQHSKVLDVKIGGRPSDGIIHDLIINCCI